MAEEWNDSGMISERTFSQSFAGFWAELLPLLSPMFVHMFNEGLREEFFDTSGALVRPISRMMDVGESAIIAEFAFRLAKLSIESRMSISEAFRDERARVTALEQAMATVRSYEEAGGEIPTLLTELEQEEGLALACNYEYFLDQRGRRETAVFCPRIPGAGFVSSCEADISIAGSLFEVKTVNRNIASKDIRQLLVYLALQAATGERRWSRAGFFNPRKSEYHEFNIDNFIAAMSGGRSSVEVFREIVEFASSREIQLDNVF